MSLLKRGGVWWNYFYLDGVRQQKSTGTGNRRLAEQIAEKQKQEAHAQRHQIVRIDPDLTFGQVAARFLAEGTPRPHHVERLQFLLPYFEEIPVVRLTKSQATDYRVQRKRAKPVSDATVNRDLSVLRHLLYWALDEQLIAANPLARLRLVRERRKARQVLSVEEELRVLPVAAAHLQPIIIAALDTGMRRGEITGQIWEHIDLTRRVLSVTRSKTAGGEGREIPLTTRLASWLIAHQQPSGLVFTYEDAPLRIIKRSWRSALQRAGLRHLRFHDLRHTFNTRLMEAGVLQEVRMALMGHSAGQSINAVYTHIELPVKRAAMARLEAWVNTQATQLNPTDTPQP